MRIRFETSLIDEFLYGIIISISMVGIRYYRQGFIVVGGNVISEQPAVVLECRK